MSAERPSEATMEARIRALAAALRTAMPRHWSGIDGHREQAEKFLASDWLAAHDAQVCADRDREWQVARDRLADYYEARGVMVADLRALAPDVAGEGQEEGT